MCKILVGDEESRFYINEALLQSTTFYAKHGLPKRHDIERPQSVVPAQQLSIQHDGSDLLFEKDRSQTVENDGVLIDLTDSDADYKLKGKFFYCRKAFALFVDHLYNAEIATPKESDGCRALFKAYALATCYNIEALQNDIIKILQKYYTINMISITDLMYVIDHWGDKVNTNLASYLVAQVGFEMAQDWTRFRTENDELTDFLGSANRVVIEEVFRAAMQHAKPQSSNDPAKNKRNWRAVLL